MGLTPKIKRGTIKIVNRASTTTKGMKKNSLYTLYGLPVIPYASVPSQIMQDKVVALRLGHISEKNLVELGKQNLLGGNRMDKAEFCVLRKSHILKFGVGNHVFNRPF